MAGMCAKLRERGEVLVRSRLCRKLQNRLIRPKRSNGPDDPDQRESTIWKARAHSPPGAGKSCFLPLWHKHSVGDDEFALPELLKVVSASLLEGNDIELAEDCLEESFSRLRTLAVNAMGRSQWLIWRRPQPRELHSLALCIGGADNSLPYYTCLGSCLRLNTCVDTLHADFVRRDGIDQIQNMAGGRRLPSLKTLR